MAKASQDIMTLGGLGYFYSRSDSACQFRYSPQTPLRYLVSYQGLLCFQNNTLLRLAYTSVDQQPQLSFKEPQIPSNREHKALNRGTLGGQGKRETFNSIPGAFRTDKPVPVILLMVEILHHLP